MKRHRAPLLPPLLLLLATLPSLPCAAESALPSSPAQHPASSPAPQPRLTWARGSVFCEIFVRSFADSDGDGIGDLRGLTSRLDYLNDGDASTTTDLGIEGIWLMPVFASPSYHGYDTIDYEAINPPYGTTADFDAFIAAAHARGIRVVLDLVINHTSNRHPWFVESSASPRAPKHDWYVWRTDDPGWRQPWGGGPTWHELNGAYYYGVFGGGMPDLNFENPSVRAEVKAIASYWLERGVDGFRLDAARHLVEDGPGDLQTNTPGTHAFWKEFAAHVRSVEPEALLVGENWTSTENIAPYFGSTATVAGGDELPMSFDFPLAGSILRAVRTGDASPIVATLADIARLYPAGVLDGTFLSNHDTPRVATELGSDPVRLRSAAALLLTLPGSPFLYYGEEIGLAGGKPDPNIRTPMPWNDREAGGGFTTGTPWRLRSRRGARRRTSPRRATTRRRCSPTTASWFTCARRRRRCAAGDHGARRGREHPKRAGVRPRGGRRAHARGPQPGQCWRDRRAVGAARESGEAHSRFSGWARRPASRAASA